MAELSLNNSLSLIELAKRSKNQDIVAVSEVLDRTNQMLSDSVWMDANGETTHTFTTRTSLPSGTYKKVNLGVETEASTSRQTMEPMAELQSYSQIDVQLYEKAGNPAMFRSMEERAFIEGLGQTWAGDILYGNNSVDPEKLNGIANRSDWSGLGANCVSATGSTSSVQTSVYIIQWGPMYVHFAYPKSAPNFMLISEDKGKQMVHDSNNSPYDAYMTKFGITGALCIKDPRCVQRICNIENSGDFDDDLIVAALNRMPNLGQGAVIYVSRETKTYLDIIAKDQTNIQYMPAQFGGIPQAFYKGTPIHMNEAILTTEAVVS